MGYIYNLKNKETGEMYIGQTTRTPKIRFKEHIKDSKLYRTLNRKLYIAINEYGASNFSFETLEICDNLLLDEREEYYINLYDTKENGYNETFGGKGKPLVNEELEKGIIEFYTNNKCTLEETGTNFNLSKDTIKVVLDKNEIRIDKVIHSMDFKIKMVDKETTIIFDNFEKCIDWLSKNKGNDNTRIKDSILRVIRGERKSYLKCKFSKVE